MVLDPLLEATEKRSVVLGIQGVESFKEAGFIFNHKSQWSGRKSFIAGMP